MGGVASLLAAAAAFLGIGLILEHRARAAPAPSPGRRDDNRGAQPPPAPRPAAAFPPFVERWRGELAKRASDLPVDAMLEWLRIESGGDMCAKGSANELGIWQLNFPDDAKYGATIDGLRAICTKSAAHNPTDISWMSAAELDMEVGAGVRKFAAARDTVRSLLRQAGVAWPEDSFDFGTAIKQLHAAPAVMTELLGKVSHVGGPPSSWSDFRARVMAFPAAQMGPGLQRLASSPSQHGLRNRLEDTMRNAEIVGVMWASAARASLPNV